MAQYNTSKHTVYPGITVVVAGSGLTARLNAVWSRTPSYIFLEEMLLRLYTMK